MKKSIFLIILLFFYSYCFGGDTTNPHTGELQKITDWQTEDGNTKVYAPETIKVTNGTLTDNGDGTASLDFSGSGVDTSGTPIANDYARFTDADTIEGRSYSEVKSDLDLEIGTDVQAYHANLASLAGLTYASISFVKMTEAGTFALDTATYIASTQLDDSKGDGDTTYLWSADKIFDQLALKQGTLTNSAGLYGALSDETGSASGTPLAVFNVNPTFEDITLNAAGVKISDDADGAITFLGLGDGFDEDLTINFDDTENVIGISSSTGVTDINFGTINLMTDLLDLGTNTLDDTHLGYIKGWEHGSDNSKLDGADIYAGSIAAGAYAAAGIDGDDINSNIAGRSLTLTSASPDTLDIDAEIYTDTKCIYWEDPVATDDFNSIWKNGSAGDYTITEMWGESDQTVVFNLQIDDGSPADVNSTDLTAAAGEVEDTSLDGDTTLAAGEELDLKITSVSNTPTWCSVCWTYQKND